MAIGIAGVKKYATHEANWSKADGNTSYLGHIIGMGIESSNLADITMSIERQFLTRKTKRVRKKLCSFKEIGLGEDGTPLKPGVREERRVVALLDRLHRNLEAELASGEEKRAIVEALEQRDG